MLKLHRNNWSSNQTDISEHDPSQRKGSIDRFLSNARQSNELTTKLQAMSFKRNTFYPDHTIEVLKMRTHVYRIVFRVGFEHCVMSRIQRIQTILWKATFEGWFFNKTLPRYRDGINKLLRQSWQCWENLEKIATRPWMPEIFNRIVGESSSG